MGWRGILGFEYGIVQAPLGPDISGPELVAAVANAGGLGLLRAPDWEAPDYLRELIRKTRTLTDKPFGIGVVLAFPHEENVKVILEEKVAVLQVYWGECSKELVQEAHHAGVKIIPQVGSVEGARKAADAGVDAIIVQGHEAGGHVIGQEGLIALLPRVVDLVGDRDIPVIAAGGIVDGRGYVAALALGAQAVCLGTRFVATQESHAHPVYKKKLIELDRAEYTDIFGRARWPNAPQRALQTPFFNEWKALPPQENELNQPVIGHSTIHGVEKEIRRFAGTVPNAAATGDVESMAMYAGQGVGLIKEILPAGEVVKSIVKEAQLLSRGLAGASLEISESPSANDVVSYTSENRPILSSDQSTRIPVEENGLDEREEELLEEFSAKERQLSEADCYSAQSVDSAVDSANIFRKLAETQDEVAILKRKLADREERYRKAVVQREEMYEHYRKAREHMQEMNGLHRIQEQIYNDQMKKTDAWMEEMKNQMTKFFGQGQPQDRDPPAPPMF